MTPNPHATRARAAQVSDQDKPAARLTKPTTAASPQLTAALNYAALGYGVMPCNGKVPTTKHGLHDATTDPVVIRRVFTTAANVGIVPPPGVLVLDFDVPKEDGRPLGERRQEALEHRRRYQSEYPELATAPLARSAGHGWHLWLRVPDDAPRLTGKFPPTGPKIGDLRGLGKSYLIVPPSTIDGSAYRWLTPLVAPHDLPGSRGLLDHLSPPQRAPRPVKPLTATSPEKLTAYVLAAVTNEHDALAATQAGRHHATLKAAIALGSLVVAAMLDEHDATDALLAASTTNGYIAKIGRAAVERTITDGLAIGAKYPRQVGKP